MGWKFSVAGLGVLAVLKSALGESRHNPLSTLVAILCIVIVIALYLSRKDKNE